MLDLKIDALRSLYKAEIAMYTAEVKNYIQIPVAVGDHGNLVETMDKLIAKIAEAEDKLLVLETHFSE